MSEGTVSALQDEIEALCTVRDELVRALQWISEIADKEHERDTRLRADGARTLRRIIERADQAIAKAKGGVA